MICIAICFEEITFQINISSSFIFLKNLKIPLKYIVF